MNRWHPMTSTPSPALWLQRRGGGRGSGRDPLQLAPSWYGCMSGRTCREGHGIVASTRRPRIPGRRWPNAEVRDDVTMVAVAFAISAGGGIKSGRTRPLLSGAQWVAALKKDWLIKPFSAEYARTKMRAWLLRTYSRWMKAPLSAGRGSTRRR
jgi:hypothetical protein